MDCLAGEHSRCTSDFACPANSPDDRPSPDLPVTLCRASLTIVSPRTPFIIPTEEVKDDQQMRADFYDFFTPQKKSGGETTATLRDRLVTLCTPLRLFDGPPAIVRCDPAPGFQALVQDSRLANNHIQVDLGQRKNVNKNPVAERAIEEVPTPNTYHAELPPATPNPTAGPEDATSVAILQLLDPAVLQRYQPLSVEEDDNCFYRAISRVLYGHDLAHPFLRLLTTMEIAEHRSFYDREAEDAIDLIEDEMLRDEDYSAVLRHAVHVRLGRYASFHYMLAMSSVLGTPFESYCPPTGHEHAFSAPLTRDVRGQMLYELGLSESKDVVVIRMDTISSVHQQHGKENERCHEGGYWKGHPCGRDLSVGMWKRGKKALEVIMNRALEPKTSLSIIILAGYLQQIEDQIFSLNEGFRGRFPDTVHFLPLTVQELTDILEQKIKLSGYTISDYSREDMETAIDNIPIEVRSRHNARLVNQLIVKANTGQGETTLTMPSTLLTHLQIPFNNLVSSCKDVSDKSVGKAGLGLGNPHKCPTCGQSLTGNGPEEQEGCPCTKNPICGGAASGGGCCAREAQPLYWEELGKMEDITIMEKTEDQWEAFQRDMAILAFFERPINMCILAGWVGGVPARYGNPLLLREYSPSPLNFWQVSKLRKKMAKIYILLSFVEGSKVKVVERRVTSVCSIGKPPPHSEAGSDRPTVSASGGRTSVRGTADQVPATLSHHKEQAGRPLSAKEAPADEDDGVLDPTCRRNVDTAKKRPEAGEDVSKAFGQIRSMTAKIIPGVPFMALTVTATEDVL
ncbi:hypothetical protein Bbelb_318180 [Branchiostoma belcheri]|nr:hypothetical protein Bbelb_318180 [Branchiostoma belcheri]